MKYPLIFLFLTAFLVQPSLAETKTEEGINISLSVVFRKPITILDDTSKEKDIDGVLISSGKLAETANFNSITGLILNFNYAHRLTEHFKIQPYLGLSTTSYFTGYFNLGILGDYEFKKSIKTHTMHPSLGLKINALTHYTNIRLLMLSVPATAKYFLTDRLAINFSFEPLLIFQRSNLKTKKLDLKGQIGIHYFFEI